MRISDWSSDVCSSDLRIALALVDSVPAGKYAKAAFTSLDMWDNLAPRTAQVENVRAALLLVARGETPLGVVYGSDALRSEEHTSELQSLMRNSYAVFCLKKKQNKTR